MRFLLVIIFILFISCTHDKLIKEDLIDFQIQNCVYDKEENKLDIFILVSNNTIENILIQRNSFYFFLKQNQERIPTLNAERIHDRYFVTPNDTLFICVSSGESKVIKTYFDLVDFNLLNFKNVSICGHYEGYYESFLIKRPKSLLTGYFNLESYKFDDYFFNKK